MSYGVCHTCALLGQQVFCQCCCSAALCAIASVAPPACNSHHNQQLVNWFLLSVWQAAAAVGPAYIKCLRTLRHTEELMHKRCTADSNNAISVKCNIQQNIWQTSGLLHSSSHATVLCVLSKSFIIGLRSFKDDSMRSRHSVSKFECILPLQPAPSFPGRTHLANMRPLTLPPQDS